MSNLIWMFLREKGLSKTQHSFEIETGIFFDVDHFEGLVMNGRWDEAEAYVSSFGEWRGDLIFEKIFFTMRKQQFLEALDRSDHVEARYILREKIDGDFRKSWYEQLYELLTLNNFRECKEYAHYPDTLKAREAVVGCLKNYLKQHPTISEKLKFPDATNLTASMFEINCLLERLLNRRNSIWTLPFQQVNYSSISNPEEAYKISRLIYTNSGMSLLALSLTGINILWKWPREGWNPKRNLTIKPEESKQMKNDLTNANGEETITCFGLSYNDRLLASGSGGSSISLFNTSNETMMRTFFHPPHVATSLLFHPECENIIFVGMNDSTIQIYHVDLNEVKLKLEGHSSRVTGLTFSRKLNALISSATDAEIIVWEYSEKLKEKKKSCIMQILLSSLVNTQVHFHRDEQRFLAVSEFHLAIYEATQLECETQWNVVLGGIGNSGLRIVQATFSCDGQLVYTLFQDGTVVMFRTSGLLPTFQIRHTASHLSCPLAIAAHPHDRDQIALGSTDGKVVVIELIDSQAQQTARLLELRQLRQRSSAEQDDVSSSSSQSSN